MFLKKAGSSLRSFTKANKSAKPEAKDKQKNYQIEGSLKVLHKTFLSSIKS